MTMAEFIDGANMIIAKMDEQLATGGLNMEEMGQLIEEFTPPEDLLKFMERMKESDGTDEIYIMKSFQQMDGSSKIGARKMMKILSRMSKDQNLEDYAQNKDHKKQKKWLQYLNMN